MSERENRNSETHESRTGMYNVCVKNGANNVQMHVSGVGMMKTVVKEQPISSIIIQHDILFTDIILSFMNIFKVTFILYIYPYIFCQNLKNFTKIFLK